MERKFVTMADRFFRNEMPDFVAEIALDETVSTESAKDSLTKLLYLPYTTLSDRLKRSALDLKETVFHFFEFLRSIFSSIFYVFISMSHFGKSSRPSSFCSYTELLWVSVLWVFLINYFGILDIPSGSSC